MKILIVLVFLNVAVSAQFTVKEIYQDNPIAGETNNLYVRFSYSQPLYGGSTITISNLANANAVVNRQLFTVPNMKSGDVSGVQLLSCLGSPGVGCWTQGSSPFLNSLTMTVTTGSVNYVHIKHTRHKDSIWLNFEVN